MSYGVRGSSGTTVSSSASIRSADRSTSTIARRREVVLRQVREQRAGRVERARLRRAPRGARRRSASYASSAPPRNSRVDVFVGHGLHDVRTGDEHVARAFDHDGEVGDGRRIDRAAGARAEDHRDLRHDARRQDVAQEDVGVAAERHDAFLDPRAARIVETDDRRADLHRQIHDLADLLGVRLRQRSTEDREVLAEDEDRPAVDGTVTGDDAVAEERFASPIASRLRDERVELDERPGSSSRSSRSRAVSLPASCCFSTRAAPPPCSDAARICSSERESLRVGRHRSTLLSGCLCARTVAIISVRGATRSAVEATPDIHRFGEQLRKACG